jgi:hypothetical protein
MTCKHEFTEDCYGFGKSSGWRGIGIGTWCMDCYTVIAFIEDKEDCSADEIEHNKIKREGINERHKCEYNVQVSGT